MTTSHPSFGGGYFDAGSPRAEAAAAAADALLQAAAARAAARAQPDLATSGPMPEASAASAAAPSAAPPPPLPPEPAVPSASVRRRALLVGSYVGLPSVEAIEQVRTTGLRPVPDRQETPDEHLHGVVLAQEPDPGQESSRGEQVLLFVGAPILKRSGGIPVHPASGRAAAPPSDAAVSPSAALDAAMAAPPCANPVNVDLPASSFTAEHDTPPLKAGHPPVPAEPIAPVPASAPDPPVQPPAPETPPVPSDADLEPDVDDVDAASLEDDDLVAADQGDPLAPPPARRRGWRSGRPDPSAHQALVPVQRQPHRRRLRARHVALLAIVAVVVCTIAVGTLSTSNGAHPAAVAPDTVTVPALAPTADRTKTRATSTPKSHQARNRTRRAAAKRHEARLATAHRRAAAPRRAARPQEAASAARRSPASTSPSTPAPPPLAAVRPIAPPPAAAAAAPARSAPTAPRASGALTGRDSFENGQ